MAQPAAHVIETLRRYLSKALADPTHPAWEAFKRRLIATGLQPKPTLELGRFGITEDQITAGTYPCLKPKSAGGTGAEYEQEHDGRSLKANEIQPYSIAVWQAQASGAAPDRRGMTVLGVLGDQAPTLLNTSSAYVRDVFNVIPTTKVTDTASKEYQVFVGKDSLLCKQSAVIAQQGFGVLATTCGDTSSRS